MKLAVKYPVLFGEGLRVARSVSVYKNDQEGLAKRLGVTSSTVSRWETGETSPKVEQVALLAKVLGFKLSSFYKDVEVAINHLRDKGVEVIIDPKKIGDEVILISGKSLRAVLES